MAVTVSRRTRELIRQIVLIVVIMSNAALSEVASGASNTGGHTDVVSTVRAGSQAVLWMAGYLSAFALACSRPLIKELPRLTMHTIWGHVYGLGLLIFVTIYCLMGVSSWCTSMYMAALAGVSMDDIVARFKEAYTRRLALFACVILSAAAAVVVAWQSPDFKSLSEAADAENWFSVACSTVLPLAAPFLYNIVRGPQRYTTETIMEFIYFAMPFAAILSTVVLCTLSAVPPSAPAPPIFFLANWTVPPNASARTLLERDVEDRIMHVTAADVAMPLLPITMLASVFLSIQCALDFDAIEFLAPLAVVVSAKHLHQEGQSQAFILACFALALRLYACCQAQSPLPLIRQEEEREDDDAASLNLIPQKNDDGLDKEDCEVAEV